MDYLVAFFSIIFVDIILSGDNALVIALACRRLSDRQRKKAIIWGSIGAIVFRIALSFVAFYLLQIPYLQIVGGIMLLWIAVKLISQQEDHSEEVKEANSLMAAIKIIVMADLVMSIDNVLAIVGVAKENISFLILGLAISIPIIIWGSRAIMALMEKWPVIITLGAAFLGWTGGEMMAADTVTAHWNHRLPIDWLLSAFCAVFVVVIGKIQVGGRG